MVKRFHLFWLFKYKSVDSTVSDGVTIIVGMVEAISASATVINTAGLTIVSSNGAFLAWGWVVLVFFLFHFLILLRYQCFSKKFYILLLVVVLVGVFLGAQEFGCIPH